MPASPTHVASLPAPGVPIGRYRWVICALLFFATTINYVDRQVIGLLKPTLQARVRLDRDRLRQHHLRLPAGVCDRPGRRRPHDGSARHEAGLRDGHRGVERRRDRARRGAPLIGPATAAALGLVGIVATPSVAGFMLARFVLGLGEAGNFPAAIKSVAEWFPKTGTRAGHRHLQLRHQRRRAADAAGRAVDHAVPGVVLGVRDHRTARVPLDRLLVDDVLPAGEASPAVSRGARLHPERSARKP